MAIRDSINTLCEYWDDVIERLGEDVHVFKGLVHNLVDQPNDTTTTRTFVLWMGEVLPPDHPVLLAVSLDDDRSPDAALRWTRTIAKLARLLDDL